jgi:FkbM family methyltransferase
MSLIFHALRPIPGLEYRVAIDPDDPDPVGIAIASGCYGFSPSQLFLYELLRKNDRVVDLGAHVGTFALGAAALGCDVVAVEAAPGNVRLLEAGIRENRFDRVRVLSAAVSDRPGVLRFVANGPFGRVCGDGYTGPSIEVPAVTLDGLLDEVGWDRIDYVKIDIEGAEIAAFRGMPELLGRKDAPAIVYESNGYILESHGLSSTHLMSMLETFGYRSYSVEKGTVRPIGPREVQIRTVVDYVAVKDPPGVEPLVARAPGWRVNGPPSLDDRVEEVAEAALDVFTHRAYLAGALARADDELLSDPRIFRTIQQLEGDDVEEVREAVRRAGTKARSTAARRRGRSDTAFAEESRKGAQLAARVERLEQGLAERSRLIRRLAGEVCDDDVLVLSWLATGSRPPISGDRGLRRWVETTELTTADVETTMRELWRTDPPRLADEEP